ncbi:MG2 domain-containing protein [uncultured Psychrosphaera sp.]|uniref:alpha-2-macroglobulin family protein n=1 Tax=uncultured Psychrosphaera sp. TaxID=1403522 RepID=UPI0026236B51|nr:MG2 domain-containing protein [uncultured Psychrosphaera sp.]
MDEQDKDKKVSLLSKVFNLKVLKFLGFVGKQFLFGGFVAILLAAILGIIILFTSGPEMALKGVAIFASIFAVVLPILSILDIITLKKPKWFKPSWTFIVGYIKRFKKTVISVVVLVTLAVIGYNYYLSLPQPVSYTISNTGPGLTRYNSETLHPEAVYIRFKPSKSRNNKNEEVSRSVAKLELLGKEITSGITMTPEVAGVWRWNEEDSLKFQPKQDWPAGKKYTVSFDASIFKPDLLLNNDSTSFTTPRFKMSLASFELYQDPQVTNSHKVVATLNATHPVELESIKENLTLIQPLSGKGSNGEYKYKFDVKSDKHQRRIYITSEKIKIQDSRSYMYLELDKGIEPIYGDSSSAYKVKKTLSIPSVSSFFKVNRTGISLVKDSEDEPEQALVINFTDQISSEDVIGKTKAYLLPTTDAKGRSKYWSRTSDVGFKELLKPANEIKLTAVPTEHDTAKLHSFTLDAPENRQVFISLDSGLKSTNGFVMGNRYERFLETPAYPKEVNIMSDGAILSKNGDHKLSFLTRGIKEIEVDISKVHENQINHLISQTSGRITSPDFKSYYFSEENISTLSTKHIKLKDEHPKKAVYSSLDLSDSYTPADGLGLFIIDARAWDPVGNYSFGRTDRRLILITDLGILVKNNADGSHDLFVQSIETGKPVGNTSVSLLAKNGLSVLTAKTDAKGHAYFPITSSFKRDKEPVAFVVKKGSDISFIPYNRYDRTVNYSRFDTGGVRTSQNASNQINAFVFSSRGIYRPGDEVNLATIVKQQDFSALGAIPLELRVTDPRGATVYKKRVRLEPNGLIDFSFKTEYGSATGNYYASVALVEKNRHRQLGSTNFKVEEFQADRLKIKSEFAQYKSKGWVTASEIKALVNLENLFGTPAQNRRVTANIRLTPANFYFNEYAKYKFSDSYYDNKNIRQRNENLDETKTDKNGKAEFDIDLKNYEAGTYRLNFSVQGYEEGGGRSVRSSTAMLVSPASELVGYKADGDLGYISRDSDRVLNFVNINSDVKQIARNDLSLQLTQQQYISTLVLQNNGTYKYQSVRKDKLLSTEKFSITEKGTDYKLPTDTAGVYLLELVDQDGNKLTKVHFTVVGAGNLAGKLERNAELQLQLNKGDYKSGEEIEMSIVAPYTGSGLITIETNKVHAHKWFKTTTLSSVQTIKLPAGIEGNAYINVSFVRDVDSKEIFTSPLSYAVKSFSIDRSTRIVDLDLGVPKKIKPGDELTISYSSAKPSSVVLYAVDEGILQVAKYQTPKPLNHFLQKRALEVGTMQIVDLILPAFRLVQEFAAAGGGVNEMVSSFRSKQLNPFSRKVEKPVAFWSGVLSAGPETKQHTFVVPDTFSGTLRVMAVAVNNDGVGVQEHKTLVRGPFVLTPNVLTAAAPGDEFEVVLGVANGVEQSGKQLPIDIDVTTSDNLQILGENKLSLKIDENSEDKVTLRVKVLNKLGAASISFTASAGEKYSRRTATLSVRPPVPLVSTFESGLSESGKEEFDVPRTLYPSLSNNKITASQSPLALVDGLVNYLNTFPHMCTEQVVSGVFPILNYLEHPTYMGDVDTKYERLNNLINTLRKRQLPNGSYMLWPASNYESTYASLYVMHFLLDAKEKGVAIPNDMWKKGFEAVRKIAHNSSSSSSTISNRNRAYAIYLLTRKGDVTTNYLFDLEKKLKSARSKEWRRDIASVFIGATYKLMRVEDKAESFIEEYSVGKKSKNDRWSSYDSRLTHDGQYVYLLAKHFPTKLAELEKDKLFTFVEPIFEGQYNTLSSAWSVIAMSAYSQAVLPKGVEEDVTVTAFKASKKDGEEAPGDELTVEHNPYPKASFFTDIEKLKLFAQPNSFYMLSQSGFDTNLPKEAVSEGLEVIREFQDDKGNVITGKVAQGQELNVVLKIRSTTGSYVPNVAVVDLLPGGFEVETESVRRGYNGWKSDYQDVREDRVVFYGGFGESVTTLTYQVKATTIGSFVIPPVSVESMYDLTIKANSTSGRFDVISSK